MSIAKLLIVATVRIDDNGHVEATVYRHTSRNVRTASTWDEAYDLVQDADVVYINDLPAREASALASRLNGRGFVSHREFPF